MATARTKFILRAPIGAHESVIDGTPYYPDKETGHVETYHAGHRDVLKQHGYVVIGEDSAAGQKRAAPLTTPIDIDECNRVELAQALAARHVDYPNTASRGDLVALAEAFNGRPTGDVEVIERPIKPQPAATPPASPPPPPQRPVSPPADALSFDPNTDFALMSATDLKGYLSSRGVAFAGNASKDVLAKAARDYFVASQKPAESEAV